MTPATVAELRAIMYAKMNEAPDEDEAKVRGRLAGDVRNNTGRVRGNPLGMGASMLHWGGAYRELLVQSADEGVLP